MSFTTTSSSTSAGPSHYSFPTRFSRLSSFSSTCSGDEIVPRNTGPFPEPIQRPKKIQKVNVGLGLGLPLDVLSSSFRDPSETTHLSSSELSSGPSVEHPTKAELRSIRVAALRGLGIFLDENPRPTTSPSTTSSSPSPLPPRRPSLTRRQAHRLTRADGDQLVFPTFFTHSPLPLGPVTPPSSPAHAYDAPPASTLPVPFPRPHAGCVAAEGKEVIMLKNYTYSPFPATHTVEQPASSHQSSNFHPFSPVDEMDFYLPSDLLASPEAAKPSYMSSWMIYETSA